MLAREKAIKEAELIGFYYRRGVNDAYEIGVKSFDGGDVVEGQTNEYQEAYESGFEYGIQERAELLRKELYENSDKDAIENQMVFVNE